MTRPRNTSTNCKQGRAVLHFGVHFDQGQFAGDDGDAHVVLHLADVDQLVQLLGDLLDFLLVAVDD